VCVTLQQIEWIELEGSVEQEFDVVQQQQVASGMLIGQLTQDRRGLQVALSPLRGGPIRRISLLCRALISLVSVSRREIISTSTALIVGAAIVLCFGGLPLNPLVDLGT
jgi:hypothetical protein